MSRVDATLVLNALPVDVITTVACTSVRVFQISGWHAPFTITDTGADVTEVIPTDGSYTFEGNFSAGQVIGTIGSWGGASNPAEPSAFSDVATFMMQQN